jgi:urease accessory protein
MLDDACTVHGEGRGDRAGNTQASGVVGWHARLELCVEAPNDASLLAHCRHRGPLRVQRPFYPEGPEVCHLCLLHPPGGLVPGDELDIELTVGRRARALVTTPAAAKVYRSDGRRAVQRQRLLVASGASLEWLPQETIFFNGAIADLRTTVLLDEGAAFVGWEVLCLGRHASGERFTVGRCRNQLEIHRAGVPLYVDRAAWEGGSDALSASYGLGGHVVWGTMLAVGRENESLEELLDLARRSAPPEVGTTLLGQGTVLCCRYLGPSAGRGRELFSELWAVIRPRLLGRSAAVPRIWST